MLTLGGDGAYYHDHYRREVPRSGFRHQGQMHLRLRRCLRCGICGGLVHGFDPETCVRFAQATSALNATGLGSQAGVKDFEHTLNFMKTTKTK